MGTQDHQESAKSDHHSPRTTPNHLPPPIPTHADIAKGGGFERTFRSAPTAASGGPRGHPGLHRTPIARASGNRRVYTPQRALTRVRPPQPPAAAPPPLTSAVRSTRAVVSRWRALARQPPRSCGTTSRAGSVGTQDQKESAKSDHHRPRTAPSHLPPPLHTHARIAKGGEVERTFRSAPTAAPGGPTSHPRLHRTPSAWASGNRRALAPQRALTRSRPPQPPAARRRR